MPLTDAEKNLADTIEFDKSVFAILKEHNVGELLQAFRIDDEYEHVPGNGVSAIVDRKTVVATLATMQPRLVKLGYRGFWSERRDANGHRLGEEIIILKTLDQFTILDFKKTCGGNYGLQPHDVAERLRSWNAQFSLSIVGASESWAAIQFSQLPGDVCTFAEQIFDFCPDVVYQGFELMREQDDPATFAAAQTFFPELSVRMQEKLVEDRRKYATLELPPEMRSLLTSSAAFSTSTEMGIRLLAYHINRDREVFLWWD